MEFGPRMARLDLCESKKRISVRPKTAGVAPASRGGFRAVRTNMNALQSMCEIYRPENLLSGRKLQPHSLNSWDAGREGDRDGRRERERERGENHTKTHTL